MARTSQPTWLRAEWSYRLYVRSLRCFPVAGSLALVAGLLGRAQAPVALVPGLMVVGAGCVLAGGVGWMCMPDKNRANLDQRALLRMVAHDIVRGLPARSAGPGGL